MANVQEDFTGYTEKLVEEGQDVVSYLETATQCLHLGFELLTTNFWAPDSRPNWKPVQKSKATGDVLYSHKHPEHGRVYCLEAHIECHGFSLDDLYHELVYNFTQGPSWDPDLAETSKLMDVGLQTDLTYSASNEIMGGAIKPRDFVDVRCWRNFNNAYWIAATSVEHAPTPPIKGRIRAQNVFRIIHMSHQPDSNTITYTMINRIDLKGQVPKPMIEKAMQHVLLNHSKLLRKLMSGSSEKK